MACSSLNIPASHIVTARLRRSLSREELHKHGNLRRSFSDNQLLHSATSLQATSSARPSILKPSRSFGVFPDQCTYMKLSVHVKSLLLDKEVETDKNLVDNDFEDDETGIGDKGEQKVEKGNWVSRLLQLRTRWKGRQEKEVKCSDKDEHGGCDDGCSVDYGDRAAERVRFDAESFSKLLIQVPWSDAKRFSKLAKLCNMAYTISEIKGHELQQEHRLHMVTSSLVKKAEAIAVKEKLEHDPTHLKEEDLATPGSLSGKRALERDCAHHPSVAYEIAASAASHVQCIAKCESYSTTQQGLANNEEMYLRPRDCKSERAAQMAASTMTAVVAAREREKQKVAKELQSLHSSPCEWFICDDPATNVRYFVIQGSESLASWQANLFFEPTEFEETDTLVHRGIYEAAKGIYEQLLPEIQNHIITHGENAKFQFTGHSLGGSLSLLVHIILVARRAVRTSALLPVVTFGSPFVFCGGAKLLEQVGLDESMVQCMILHRDIVPRAFSCNYPRQIAQILAGLNGSFRSHPCLNKNKMLYSPLGRMFILQPAERLSPSHPMLPPGCGLYAFDNTEHTTAAIALRAFLNNPHPLETLSDPTAYGSEGAIVRDHHSNNYNRAMSMVLNQYTKMAFRKVRNQKQLIWPWFTAPPQHHAWTHKGNLESRSTRKEQIISV